MSKVGKDLVEAFDEMAGYLRGDVEVESYELPPLDVLTPRRIGAIRRSLASSTKAFEAEFHIPARTIESYEQGRRRPDIMAALLLRILEKESDAVRRVTRAGSAFVSKGGKNTRIVPNFIALLHQDHPGSDFGVSFPQFPGCVTTGRTLDEARASAEEALGLHIEGMLADGEALPEASTLQAPDNRDGIVILVRAPATK